MGRTYTEDQLAHRNEWAKLWVDERRQRCIEYLGGRCARCGSTDWLEFDHKDPATKSFTVSGNLNRRWEALVVELDKCQLLCHDCHRTKTVEEGQTGGGWNKKYDECPHGTISGYAPPWGCRCAECKEARKIYRAAYYARTGN